MYLRNILCPHCGDSFTGGYKSVTGTGSLLGVPFMRCQHCRKLCDSGKMAWSQMNFFGKGMEIAIALFKTFFTGLIFAVPIGLLLIFVLQSTNWFEANRTVFTWIILSLGMALSVLRTVWHYWIGIPEIERITREKKWDEWII